MVLMNDSTLVSAADDGSFIFWHVISSEEGFAPRRPLDVKEVLVKREELTSTRAKISILGSRISELENECIFKVRQTANKAEAQLKEVHVTYREVLATLSTRIKNLEEARANESRIAAETMTAAKEGHEKSVGLLEAEYERKLVTEFERYEDLERRHEQICQDYEAKLGRVIAEKDRTLEESQSEFQARLKSAEARLRDANEQLLHETKMRDKLVNLMEEDADSQVLQLRAECAEVLQGEKKLVLQLQGEIGALKDHLQTSEKDTKLAQEKLERSQKKVKKLESSLESILQTRQDLRRELDERDKKIEESNDSVRWLKESMDVTERHKLVLEYKLREVNLRIEPQERSIESLQRKVTEMELEVKSSRASEERLKLELSKVNERVKVVQAKIRTEAQKSEEARKALLVVKVDIHELEPLLQNGFALKKAVVDLLAIYNRDKTFDDHVRSKSDVYGEVQKQRGYLERTIARLKKRIKNDEQAVAAKARSQAKREQENQQVWMDNVAFLENQVEIGKARIAELEKLLQK